ncbi:HIT family protein [Spirosoma montaniterrae]|uniref:HIT family protein n=1 Tax=Spirosoma montaniterrae TaxID=1178516 RepID=UPI001E2BB882|nr:HIT family protein [Spirosoma montaniterrae]
MNPQNPYSYLTAKQRDTPSLPIRMLHERKLLSGRILDYGCGFGQDVRFLQAKGYETHGYDPHYFPELPAQSFDTIVCFYVLNVLFPDEQTDVLMNVSRLLKPTGRAYFAVRRDITRDGFRTHQLYGKPVYQCNVQLPFTSIYRNENTEFYQYQHINQLAAETSKCPFCSPKSRLKLLTETSLTYVVLDSYPVSKGHALITPKRHVANFFDLPLSEQNECWQVVNKVQEILQERFAPDGFNVGLNIGVAAGQKFPHASIHVIPRYTTIPGGGIRNVVRK